MILKDTIVQHSLYFDLLHDLYRNHTFLNFSRVMTSPVSGCLGQVKIFTGLVKVFILVQKNYTGNLYKKRKKVDCSIF